MADSQQTSAIVLGLAMAAIVIGVNKPASAQTATPQHAPQATAQLVNAQNQEIGVATLTQTERGVEITLNARNLPANSSLAFHVHQTGKCDVPRFTTAGDHFNPTSKKHGHKTTGGAHAGDMPNQQTAADGTLATTVLNTSITLDDNKTTGIMDTDGAALILHAKPDDYKSQPSGAAGDRIACGIIKSVTAK